MKLIFLHSTINKESIDHLARTPRKAPSVLTAQENAVVQDVVTEICGRNAQSANNHWLALLTTLDQRGVSADTGELIQYILRESYLQSSQDLQMYAAKTKTINDQKKQMREEKPSKTDLQNVYQNQQQLIDTLNNFSKMLHDTAMTVIRKIR